jgi:hypothetical protein
MSDSQSVRSDLDGAGLLRDVWPRALGLSYDAAQFGTWDTVRRSRDVLLAAMDPQDVDFGLGGYRVGPEAETGIPPNAADALTRLWDAALLLVEHNANGTLNGMRHKRLLAAIRALGLGVEEMLARRATDADAHIADGAPPPADVPTHKQRPAFLRDHLFLRWYETEGADTHHHPATIRDNWNAMTDAQRADVCPSCPSRIAKGKSGTAVVNVALSTARRELGRKATPIVADH